MEAQKVSACRHLRVFAETTTVKGLPKLVKAKTKFQTGLWFLTLIAGTGFVTLQLYAVLDEFFSYEVNTSFSWTPGTAPFPDVTMCNLNPVWANNFLLSERNVTIGQFQAIGLAHYYKFVDLGETSKASTLLSLLNIGGVMQNINIANMIQHQESNPIVSCVEQDLNGVITRDKCLSRFRPVVTPQFGLCFTFSYPQHTPETTAKFSTILYLNDVQTETLSNFITNPSVTYAYGARVLVHARGTFPDMDEGVNIAPGTEATFRTTVTEHKHLGAPYSSCKHKQAIVTGNGNFTYSTKLCRHMCIQERVVQTCGCVMIEYIVPDNYSSEFCGKVNTSNIDDLYSKMDCARAVVNTITNEYSRHCQCEWSCQYSRYTSQVNQAPWPHHAFYTSFYANIIRHQHFEDKFLLLEHFTSLLSNETTRIQGLEEMRKSDLISRNFLQVNVERRVNETHIATDKPTVTRASLTGILGGILNLWLGVTFVTCIEVVDTLYLMIIATFRCSQISPTNVASNGVV